MTFVTLGWRRTLAILVIAHGLAHAVLPLRGSMEPGLFERNFMPVILYGIAVLGFTTAGIGLFGVRPFTAVVRPFLVVASTYSVVAIVTSGQGELWWGIALDAVLLLTGLTGLYRRLPQGPSHPGLPHRMAVATGAAFAVYVTCALVLWPVHRAWGSQPEEHALSLPGDRADRSPSLELQHAVTIDAPPDAVDGVRAAALHHAAQDDAADQAARRGTPDRRGDDVSDVILAAATAIANEWRVLAAAWHILVAAFGVVLWRRRVDGRAIAAVLALMPLSVATMAAWSGNPFNITMFAALGLVMLALAGTDVSAQLRLPGAREVAAGAILCAFGWVYPHFLDGPAWQYLYAAPLGLLPCPTLAFLMGVSLLTDSFGSKTWAILLGAMGMLYGLIGVFVLRVTIDWWLVAGAAVLLARAGAPLRLVDAVTLDREKRHV